MLSKTGNIAEAISYKSITRVVWVLLVLFFVYLIRDILALLFVSIIFAAAIDPWVDWLKKYKIPRAVSILVIYVVLIAVFSLIIIMLVPAMTEQIIQMVNNIPDYYEKISVGIHTLQQKTGEGLTTVSSDSVVSTLQTLSSTLAQATKSIFVTVTSIFGGILSLFVVLVMTFYITVEEDGLKKFLKYLVPVKQRDYVMDLVERMEKKVGLWLRGQLLLCFIVGIMVYFGLLFLGVEYALLLALVPGILEIIPYFGPWLSGLIAVLVVSSDSWAKIIFVAALYFIVQQLENQVIVPKIMERVVGLNPIIVIMAILIGARLGGVVGGLLGVPVAAAIAVYFEDILKEKQVREKND
ncbi:MAG TPA: AI-2E family transporter [Patescibacteria group bacterium]|nr:AI-2E family transporter [Patescibacteria group bacterium]